MRSFRRRTRARLLTNTSCLATTACSCARACACRAGRNDAPPLHIVPPLSVALNRGADLESPEGDPAVLKKGTPVDVKGEVTLPDGKVRLHLIHYESKGYGNKKVFK